MARKDVVSAVVKEWCLLSRSALYKEKVIDLIGNQC